MFPVAQAAAPLPTTFWADANGSATLWIKIAITLALGFALIFALLVAPVAARRPIVTGITFLAGLFYVLKWLYPEPIARKGGDGQLPRNAAEGFSFWLSDAQSVVTPVSNVIVALLIGLGLANLLKIHLTRLLKAQKDWGYSLVLLVCMVTFVIFGYWDWITRQGPAGAAMQASRETWGFPQYANDLLFDGLLQNMEAAMFSVVAFYILSAAYRAFRARSVEASILLVTALIVMVSLLGVVTLVDDQTIGRFLVLGPGAQAIAVLAILGMAGGTLLFFRSAGNRTLAAASGVGVLVALVAFILVFRGVALPGLPSDPPVPPGSFANNFRITEIAAWIQKNLQTPAIRGIDFGVGVGLLAMGLRLWLSLEKTGGNV